MGHHLVIPAICFLHNVPVLICAPEYTIFSCFCLIIVLYCIKRSLSFVRDLKLSLKICLSICLICQFLCYVCVCRIFIKGCFLTYARTHAHTHIHATVTHTFTEVQLYLQKLTLYRLLLLAVNDLSITVKYAGRL